MQKVKKVENNIVKHLEAAFCIIIFFLSMYICGPINRCEVNFFTFFIFNYL